MTRKELPNHLTIEELASRWGMNTGTLGNWRIQGKGPKYVKIGRKILYPINEIETWETQQLKKSTVG